MTETTLILCVSTSDTDKMIAEKCVTYLNEEMSFCHCVCPARLEFHKDSTDITVKTKFVKDPSYHTTEGDLIIAARAYLSAYLTALAS